MRKGSEMKCLLIGGERDGEWVEMDVPQNIPDYWPLTGHRGAYRSTSMLDGEAIDRLLKFYWPQRTLEPSVEALKVTGPPVGGSVETVEQLPVGIIDKPVINEGGVRIVRDGGVESYKDTGLFHVAGEAAFDASETLIAGDTVICRYKSGGFWYECRFLLQRYAGFFHSRDYPESRQHWAVMSTGAPKCVIGSLAEPPQSFYSRVHAAKNQAPQSVMESRARFMLSLTEEQRKKMAIAWDGFDKRQGSLIPFCEYFEDVNMTESQLENFMADFKRLRGESVDGIVNINGQSFVATKICYRHPCGCETNNGHRIYSCSSAAAMYHNCEWTRYVAHTNEVKAGWEAIQQVEPQKPATYTHDCGCEMVVDETRYTGPSKRFTNEASYETVCQRATGLLLEGRLADFYEHLAAVEAGWKAVQQKHAPTVHIDGQLLGEVGSFEIHPIKVTDNGVQERGVMSVPSIHDAVIRDLCSSLGIPPSLIPGAKPTICPDCHGSKTYRGLNAVEDCATCEGSGTA